MTDERIIWEHVKTGKLYAILTFAIREADMVPVVVYEALTDLPCAAWTRPADEFFDGRFFMKVQSLPEDGEGNG